MRKPMYIHWKAPCTMILSLTVGGFLALGHHFFYRSLVAKPTSTGDYSAIGIKHSTQQTNTAIGTSFAFLVKASFILAVSTGYCQMLWKTAKDGSKRGRTLTLERLDNVFSGTSNALALLNASVWFRYPLLFFMAASVWLIPIASIITPATLSVDLRENIPNSTMQKVPRIDFSNLTFVAGMPALVGYNRISLYYTYNGPSQVAKQIAMAVASRNEILSITAPFPNSSWELNFHGPSLKCNPVAPSESFQVQQNIAYYLNISDNCERPATYLAWFPTLDLQQNNVWIEPYLQTSVAPDSVAFVDPHAIFKADSCKSYSATKQDAMMYFATLPNMLNLRTYTLVSETLACQAKQGIVEVTPENSLGPMGDDMAMFQCQLYNSTYRTGFRYENGEQRVTTELIKTETDHTVPVISSVRGPGSGTIGDGCATLNEEDEHGKICKYDGSLLSQLSYQAILQAFSMLVVGAITIDGDSKGLLDSTSMRSTTLVNTKELWYLSDYTLHQNVQEKDPDLQNVTSASNMSETSGMSRLKQPAPDQPLQHAIETMFRKIVISLMSSRALQPDYSSPDAPPKINVTEFTAQTVYVYDSRKLWTAYSLAFASTLVAVLIGLYGIFSSGVSYSNSFSTVFRAARAAELSVKAQELDLDGKDPLPSYLAAATVFMSVEEGFEMVSVTKAPVDPEGGGLKTVPANHQALLPNAVDLCLP